MNLKDKIEFINGKEDFTRYIELLVENLRKNPNEWGNNNLPDYLEAVANWTDDMEGYYKNNNVPLPENINWKVFATILTAARIYE
jgi:hypothetical protein